MKWFLDLKISTKLIATFLLMAALVAFVGVRGVQNMQVMSAQMQQTFREHVEPAQWLSASAAAFQHWRVTRFEMALTAGTSGYEEFARKGANDLRILEEGIASFKKNGMTKDEELLIQQMEPDIDLAKTQFAKQREILENESADADTRQKAGFLWVMDTDGRQAATRTRDNLQKLIDVQKADVAKANEEAAQLYQTQRRTFITIVVIGVLIAFVMGFALASMITTPLQAFGKALDQVARGDLRTPDIDVKRKDEIGNLTRTLVSTIDAQRKLIGEIKDSSGQVASSADEISASAVQITKGAENQS